LTWIDEKRVEEPSKRSNAATATLSGNTCVIKELNRIKMHKLKINFLCVLKISSLVKSTNFFRYG